MEPSEKLIIAIKEFEGFNPVAAHNEGDRSDVFTIGYGETEGVKAGDRMSQQEADENLRKRVAEVAKQVEEIVSVLLTQGQFDALVDFAYNLGVHSLRDSTLLRLLDSGDYIGAADQFKYWVWSNGRKLPGLAHRRAAEEQWFSQETLTSEG